MCGHSYVLLLLATTLTSILGAGDILAVARSNGCTKIVNLIQTAGLSDTLRTTQDLTFFAPNDDAVDRIPSEVLSELQNNMTLLQDVLKFHVLGQVARAADVTNDLLVQPLFTDAKLRLNVYEKPQKETFVGLPGNPQMVQNVTVITAEGAPVSQADLEADNGVVHVIDKVIYPLPTQSLPVTLTMNPELGSVAFVAFQANLMNETVTEPLTVFAPSNEALSKLSGQLYNDLLMNVSRATEVLYTHVVRGVVFSAGLYNGQMLTNLEGTQLAVTINNGVVSVNGSRVTVADLPASNAVIHVIDTVLMPQ